MSKIYAKKVDANQPAIVKDLRNTGFSVVLDKDDIIVGKHGKTKWIEIKNGSPFRKDGKLKPNPQNKQGIQNSQYEILCTYKGEYNICWDVRQIRKLFEISILDNMPKEEWQFGITPYMLRHWHKEWLTPKELNRLRKFPWWNLG